MKGGRERGLMGAEKERVRFIFGFGAVGVVGAENRAGEGDRVERPGGGPERERDGDIVLMVFFCGCEIDCGE